MTEQRNKAPNLNSNLILNTTEFEKETLRLQKEKQTLDNLFVEINVDIVNKRKELEELKKQMELSKDTVKVGRI